MAYFDQLASELKDLTQEERAASIDFYQEFAHDAGLTSDAEISQHFGRPQQLARKILADYSIDQIETQQAETPKNYWKLIGIVILGLLSLPLGVPLGIVIIITITSIVIMIAAAFLSVQVVLWSTGLLGVVFVVAGVGVIGASIGVALSYIGIGLVMFGIFMLLWPMMYRGLKRLSHWSAQKFGHLYQWTKTRVQAR